jgi:hypothetical protein
MNTIRVCSVVMFGSVVFSALSPMRCLAVDVVLHVSPDGQDESAGNISAPLANPQSAIGRLPSVAASQPDARIRVVLRGGVYRIEQPLRIEQKHVPSRGSLTFAAAIEDLDKPVVISGGRRLTGWEIREDGTWSLLIPEVSQGTWLFRELFVNGQRRPRARHPNTGSRRIDRAFEDKRSGFTFAAGDLPEDWTSGGELLFLHDWSTSRIPVNSVDHTSRRLTVAFPIGYPAEHFKIDHFESHPRFCVEDHRAFLDVPGEWFLSSEGILYYKPLPSEMPDNVEVIAPRATSLLIVSGDDAPIRNVHFDRLQFEHCTWQIPLRGFAEGQATAHEQRDEDSNSRSRNFVRAAIQFECAENCSFMRGRIAHVGGSGIQFGRHTINCRLEDTVLEDISGNGVNIGEDSGRILNGRPWWQAAPEQAASGNSVQRNRIERCGQQFFGAVAVWVGLASNTTVTNNEIAWLPYTGVSLGWMWNPTPTPAGGNIVSQNHIHHVMQLLSDGGGIYTLGRQPGTKLLENVIHDVPLNAGRAESNGMFLDEGSDVMEIVGNVIYAVERSPLRFHRAERMTVRNNTLVVATGEIPVIRYNSTNPQTIEQTGNKLVRQSEFDVAAVVLPQTGPGPTNRR